ncbi:Bifunctional adenosylcobalamin biosynthesis protein CobP [Vibrio tapetis subsp. tapetis]|uniref:Bifunctional adenosylcobalamin biosynthesis protein n=2 Tax=Vibrio tapetis TaxID=52443 RepID=A0A2N8Z9C0_9VIBR|nr:Bifunctional adenosylcobalamin biosynthesis protein CobP [Vibrio tapetis subsp. tapetis]
MIHLILGGARSGKSSYSEKQSLDVATQHEKQLHYIATAISFDTEMESRIELHQQQRDKRWQLHECPTKVPNLLSCFAHQDVILVDCLTLWLNNVLFELGDDARSQDIERRVDELVNAIAGCKGDIFLVSNEVGLGVIPMGNLTRKFVDHAGWMNQKIARVANNVTFVAAGLPLKMK